MTVAERVILERLRLAVEANNFLDANRALLQLLEPVPGPTEPGRGTPPVPPTGMSREEQRQIAEAFDLLAAVGAVSSVTDSVLVAKARRLLLPMVAKVPGLDSEDETPGERAIEAVANLMPRRDDMDDSFHAPSFAAGFDSCRARAITALSDAFASPDEAETLDLPVAGVR